MVSLETMVRPSLPLVLVVVFALSGFSGLIDESLWTHSLTLVLGHAAYAQTLVLAIFMGGAGGGRGAVQSLVVAVGQSPAGLCHHGRGERRLYTGIASGVRWRGELRVYDPSLGALDEPWERGERKNMIMQDLTPFLFTLESCDSSEALLSMEESRQKTIIQDLTRMSLR